MICTEVGRAVADVGLEDDSGGECSQSATDDGVGADAIRTPVATHVNVQRERGLGGQGLCLSETGGKSRDLGRKGVG